MSAFKNWLSNNFPEEFTLSPDQLHSIGLEVPLESYLSQEAKIELGPRPESPQMTKRGRQPGWATELGEWEKRRDSLMSVREKFRVFGWIPIEIHTWQSTVSFIPDTRNEANLEEGQVLLKKLAEVGFVSMTVTLPEEAMTMPTLPPMVRWWATCAMQTLPDSRGEVDIENVTYFRSECQGVAGKEFEKTLEQLTNLARFLHGLDPLISP